MANITGTNNGETLNGTPNPDTIQGLGGNDVLIGAAGGDVLDGGTGTDFASYADSPIGLTIDIATPANNTGIAAGDSYISIEGAIGSDFNDVIVAPALSLNRPNFFLRGGLGSDVLTGAAGNDFADYRGSATGLTVSLANPGQNTGEATGDTYFSIEKIRGSNFNDILIGNAGNNTLRGGTGADVLNGGDGTDFASYANSTSGLTANLSNSAANTGEAAGDTYISIEGLRGTDFADTLIGDGESNFLIGGPSGDVLNGGSGSDWADYNDNAVGLTVSLANSALNTDEAVGDSYISIENIRGSDFADILIGDDSNNALRGGRGADALDGQGGIDVADYRGATAGLTASLAAPGTNTGDAAGDTYTSIEGLVGTNFNDVLTGDAQDNFLRGGLVSDVLDGGAGNDWADYRNATAALRVSLANPASNDGEAAGDTFISIENIRGSDFNDILIGDAQDNFLRGGLGGDFLSGGGGHDGASYFEASTAVVANLADPSLNTGEAAGDIYVNIDGLGGSAFSDTLTGDGNNNGLRGNGGADALDGGAGFDTADYDNSTTGLVVSLANPAANTGEAAGDTYTSIEGIGGTRFDDALTGNGANNSLNGKDGSDILDGGLGADAMTGGLGNDSFIVDDAGDRAIEAIGGGNDRVFASASFALEAGSEIEQLLAGDAAATTSIGLTGNEFDNIIQANAGSNVLDGKGGVDIMFGFGGNDFYVVDNTSDRAIEAVGAGNDRVSTSVGFTLEAGREIESIVAADTAATTGIYLNGNEFDNLMQGNAGNNAFDGGGGIDIMVGLGGNDVYFVDDASDRAIEAVGAGSDQVLSAVSFSLEAGREVEGLATVSVGATTAINLTGNEFDNVLQGNAGNNFLDGGGGADVMFGFAGNDFFFVDNVSDRAIEGVGGGSDRVFTSVSFALEAGREIETFTTTNSGLTSAINLMGNEFANTILGNAGNNFIAGGGGSDLILTLGGIDNIYFDTAPGPSNVDSIADFDVPNDTIRLDDAIFAALPTGVLSANAFQIAASAQDADDRIIYNSATGGLFYDSDGTGGGAAVQFAALSTGLALTNNDFVVI